MSDPGHIETEVLLKALEKRITEEFQQAEAEIRAKLEDYLRRFDKKDKTWRKWVKEGVKTKEEYKKWRIGQLAVGKRWKEMRQTIAEDLANANLIAKSIVDGYMPEVYAINHDYGTFEVEKGSMIDTSYTLYSRESFEYLLRYDPEILPEPGTKLKDLIKEGKEIRWNRKQIQSVMIQSIVQGESIPAIADRLALEVGEKNRKAAIRNARTMTTGVEAAGRVDAYKRAENMGIDMVQMWVATHDQRTRHSHRILDGEQRVVGGVFSNGCRYPGDPECKNPGEIYNCRCTLRGIVAGLEPQSRKYRSEEGLEGMTWEEWKEAKPRSNPITLPEEKAKNIKWRYIAEYRRKHG